jgi:poly-gamma-glutamate synthesis protein (capsule biosynthesis protein)
MLMSLAGCPSVVSSPEPTNEPTATPAPTPTPAPARLMLEPSASRPSVDDVLEALIGAGADVVAANNAADLTLSLRQDPGGRTAYERILVPVDRFATLLQATSMAELQGVWTGQITSTNVSTLYPTLDAMPDLIALWGQPGDAVKPQPSAAQVADRVWGDRMGLGIVPFDQLMPRLRALSLDGLSAVDNRLDQSKWPLAARVWLNANTPRGAEELQKLPGKPLLTNRDVAKLTVLVSTGTTAITRHMGAAIAKSGDPAFPARVIGPELAAADLTAVSNEIPFMDDCAVDDRVGLGVFCAKTEWYATLALSGVNLVGLTGNHLKDFGTPAFTKTLEFYAQKGIKVYGGGLNDEAARAPLIVEDHGNRLAFLGANMFGPERYADANGDWQNAWAGKNRPGAATYDPQQLAAAIKAVKPKVDLVFAELQWKEDNDAGDYQVQPIPGQAKGFEALAEAGADVVTGVQAHAPQAIELRGNQPIFFGLGNLYFDQAWSWPTRTGLVVRHTIYAGRLLSSDLLVTVLDPNYQLRWATPDERKGVLQSVFAASGW